MKRTIVIPLIDLAKGSLLRKKEERNNFSREVNFMDTIRLSVPFHEKDEVKKLGAKWNSKEKFWYITQSEDIGLFSRWLQNENAKKNIKSSSYYIAQSFRSCWKCNYKSKVYAIILPKNKSFENEYAKILFYVTFLNKSAQSYFSLLTPHYYYDYSNVTNSSYWMNHCEDCKSRLGDFETIEEYTSPFRPTSTSEAKNITLYEINEYLEAAGGNLKQVVFLEQIPIISEDWHKKVI